MGPRRCVISWGPEAARGAVSSARAVWPQGGAGTPGGLALLAARTAVCPGPQRRLPWRCSQSRAWGVQSAQGCPSHQCVPAPGAVWVGHTVGCPQRLPQRKPAAGHPGAALKVRAQGVAWGAGRPRPVWREAGRFAGWKGRPEPVLLGDNVFSFVFTETNRQVASNLCQMGSWFGKPVPSSPFEREHVLV